MLKTKSVVKRLSVVAAVAVLAACGGGGGGDAPAFSSGPVIGQNGTVAVSSVSLPAGETCNIANFAQTLVAEINAARAQGRNCGATAMPPAPPIDYWNTRLTAAAARHSADATKNSFASHTGSDGSTPQDRADQAGYVGGAAEIFYATWGDQNAVNSRSRPAATVQRWLSSEGHCRAIMNSDYQELGGACVKNSGRMSFTVVFGY